MEDLDLDPGESRPTRPGALVRRGAWFLVAAYCVLIFIGSSIPGRDIPDPHVSDKLIHAMEYAGLGTLVMLVLVLNTRLTLATAFFAAVACAALYGVSDELHQIFTSGRDSSVLDLMADIGGSSIGAGFVACVALLRRRS